LVAQINGMTNQVEETSASSTGEIPTGILWIWWLQLLFSVFSKKLGRHAFRLF
jgi:hypothetical protein